MADSVSTEAWLDQRRWAALEEALKAVRVFGEGFAEVVTGK